MLRIKLASIAKQKLTAFFDYPVHVLPSNYAMEREEVYYYYS